MNKKFYSLMVTLMIPLISHSEGKCQAINSEETAFFNDLDNTNTVFRWVTKYSRKFAHENSLTNSENKLALKEFASRMRAVVIDEYVPSDDFIANNLLLYPARGMTRDEDVAMLPFQAGGIDYLFVQTGGPGGKIWIYSRSKMSPAVQNEKDAENLFHGFLEKYMNRDYRQYIPDMNVENHQGVFVGMPRGNLSHKKKIYTRYAVAGMDTCVSLNKVWIKALAPARLPQADEWFSWMRERELEIQKLKNSYGIKQETPKEFRELMKKVGRKGQEQ